MRYRLASVALGLLIASCSSGGQNSAVAPDALPYAGSRPSAGGGGTATVKGRIAIPIVTSLRAHYVSPSTQSVLVDVFGPGRKLLVTKSIDVRSGDKGCKSTVRQRICTFEFGIPAGKVRFVIGTFDRPEGVHKRIGNLLSVMTTGSRVVKSGETVKLPMTLAGVPYSVSMELDSFDTFATGDDKQGFQFAGLSPELMHLIPLDADGNLIIGPGAPKLSLESDARSLSIRKANGNTFVLSPHSGGTGITLAAKAEATLPFGEPVGELASLTLGSVLYVANHGSVTPGGSVTEYVPWTNTPILTIVSGVNNPGVLTVDGSGNLWVGNDAGSVAGAGSITEYAPGATTPSRTISGLSSPGVGGAEALTVDKSGNLYCACSQDSEVDEFTPSGGSAPSRTLTTTSSPQGINSPYSVVTDSDGNLYVANYGSDTIGISVFAPGTSTIPIRNITTGIHSAWLLVMDRLGNIYAGNLSAPDSITEYAAGGSAPIATFGSTSGLTTIDALAVDATGNVYAGNFSGVGTTAVQYSPSAPGAPARTFSVPSSDIFGISADPIGNVYVSNSNNSTVSEYPPGTSTTPVRILTGNGIDTPWYVATSP